MNDNVVRYDVWCKLDCKEKCDVKRCNMCDVMICDDVINLKCEWDEWNVCDSWWINCDVIWNECVYVCCAMCIIMCDMCDVYVWMMWWSGCDEML